MELVINPSQEVFNQLVYLSGTTHEWDHQPYDYKYYSENYDGYWFVAMIDKSKGISENFVAGGCLARWDVKNGDPLYSIGLFYCKEEYRRMGYGKPVFQKMMDIVGDHNCVLTAAPSMSQKYADIFGFTKMLPYRHMEAEVQSGKVKIPELSDNYTTKNWKDVDENQLETYDLSICPRPRKNRMRSWFKQEGVYTRVAFDSAQQIVGYCTIRTIVFNKLCAAPFYAENEDVASRLLADVIKEIPNFEKFEKLFLWYPAVNENMESLLSRFLPTNGFHIQEDFRTQFTKEILPARDDVVYSVACGTHQYV